MNAMPIHPAGINLRRNILPRAESRVSHDQYIEMHASNPEDRLVRLHVVLSPPCLAFNR